MRIVTYTRVSTKRQGESGLGLEAQQAAISAYAATNAAQIVAAFTEVESGRKNDRPELAKAMRMARVMGARLVIAKLDRLSRNAAFLLNLRDAGVDFVACDNPHATPLTIGVLALVAEEEARAISARTKAALTAAKARGTVLGNPNGAAALRRAAMGNGASRAAMTANADRRAAMFVDVLEDLDRAGFTTLQAVADELNRRGICTPRGKTWYPASVANLRARLAPAG